MKITCHRCALEIEHDLVFSKVALECPGCGVRLTIDLPAPPRLAASTQKGAEEYTFSNSATQTCRVVLRSGTELNITHFVLYPEKLVVSARQHMAAAEKQFAGFSTGIGFWGSPKWVLGGSLLLGAAESLVSNGMESSGNALMSATLEIRETLHNLGEPIPVRHTLNADRIDPRQWYAGYTNYGLQESEIEEGIFKKTIKKKYKLTATTRYFVQHDEPFVTVVTSDGRKVIVIWENVEQYEVLT